MIGGTTLKYMDMHQSDACCVIVRAVGLTGYGFEASASTTRKQYLKL